VTETDVVNLRRTIYLTIMSALDFEEAGHKLLKMVRASGGGGGEGGRAACACLCWAGGGRVKRGGYVSKSAFDCAHSACTHQRERKRGITF
jgi:hypothetical protein